MDYNPILTKLYPFAWYLIDYSKKLLKNKEFFYKKCNFKHFLNKKVCHNLKCGNFALKKYRSLNNNERLKNYLFLLKFSTLTITGDKTAFEIISSAKLPIASAQNTAIPETLRASVDAISLALSIKKI